MFKDVKSTDENQGDDKEDDIKVEDVPERARRNCLYYYFYKLCTHWSFNLFIIALIMANVTVLALEKYPEDEDETKVADFFNDIFSYLFIAEMVIKLIGLGFREYCRDSFNLFDAVVVILTIVDMVITATSDAENPSSALSAFRGVRLLRVFKLARSWLSFREML